MIREELNHLFGMYEMEAAVEMMLLKAESLNLSFEQVIVIPTDFTLDSSIRSLIGFCQLCCRELVEPGYPNSHFYPTRKLIDIMRQQPIWKNLPYPPTLVERYEKMIPIQSQNG
jgi:hypothetical protein